VRPSRQRGMVGEKRHLHMMASSLHRYMSHISTIDRRSLALFRIMIAVTMMVYLLSFSPIPLLLLNTGMCPMECALAYSQPHSLLSLVPITGQDWFIITSYYLAWIMSAWLFIGYRTKVATTACWATVLYFNAKGIVFTYLADSLLAALLFWSMFLPLGSTFSIDGALTANRPRLVRYHSCAGLAILLQHAYVYTVGALLKGDAWHDFSAVHIAVNSLQYSSPYSHLLATNTEATKILTACIYYLELFALPVLVLLPTLRRVRHLYVVLLVAMHIGFLIFMNVGYFPLVSICGLTLFLANDFWIQIERLRKRLFGTNCVSIYYDGRCSFCHKVSLILREFYILRRAEVLAAQRHPAMEDFMAKQNRWIAHSGRHQLLLHWEACSYLKRCSPLFWPLGLLFLMRPMHSLGIRLYRAITSRRSILSRAAQFVIPWTTIPDAKRRRPSQTVAITFLCLSCYTALHQMAGERGFYPKELAEVMTVFHLTQRWEMFANPRANSVWFEIHGLRSDGGHVRLLPDGKEALTAQSSYASDIYPNQRWVPAMRSFNWRRFGARYLETLCSWSSSSGGLNMTLLKVYQLYSPTSLEAPSSARPITRRIVFQHRCEG
jgi:predicted DCC family thiol-disulfide oxidoreductase YuxK